tara:strand:- start:188 stop:478 length:291 start_codon:yes stop_codon:yes gene_type:complete
MTRTKVVAGPSGSVTVELTKEENDARDAEEKVWSDAAPTREMAQIRQRRDTLLKETDHFGLGDVTMADNMKTYRQALRDIPASNTVYADVTWPTKP